MSEPNVLICLLCHQSFPRNEQGGTNFILHLPTCPQTPITDSEPELPKGA